MSARKSVTLDFPLAPEQRAVLERVAQLSGVKIETICKVLVGFGIERAIAAGEIQRRPDLRTFATKRRRKP